MIICYQYNFSDGRIEWVEPKRITDGQWLHCDYPKYVGYPVCTWKIKTILSTWKIKRIYE